MIDVQEQELKIKYDYLLSELYDMLGLAKLMAGNLECVVYIRKNCLKTIELTKKEDKKSNENIPLNNIIIFPLEQNDDLYVYPDEKLTGIFKKNRDDES